MDTALSYTYLFFALIYEHIRQMNNSLSNNHPSHLSEYPERQPTETPIRTHVLNSQISKLSSANQTYALRFLTESTYKQSSNPHTTYQEHAKGVSSLSLTLLTDGPFCASPLPEN